MFTVIYTFKVLPGKTTDFIYNWEELTKLIYQYENSFGSKLHKVSDLNYLAYAQWPDQETWENSGKKLPPSAKDFSTNMKASCEHSSTDYQLEVISDLTANSQFRKDSNIPKVTGIGGVFFKAKDVEKLKQWYAEHLGFAVDEYGAMFKSRDEQDAKKINYLQWSVFKNNTDYFNPSKQNYMINYRVQNIEKLISELRNKGVTILDDLETFEYGKFIHILDSEENKIELWEPIDEAFKA